MSTSSYPNVTTTYMDINTKQLRIDPLYQRNIDEKRVQRIVKKFNRLLVNPIKVSFRDGAYWIFDGQHTKCALEAIKGGPTTVECKVYHGLTQLDEMELFILQNGESASVAIRDKVKALYNMGDPQTVDFVRATELAGVRVGFTKTEAPNKIGAVSTLLSLYRALPREEYVDMLSTIRQTWDGIPSSFSREILNGMAEFYKTYRGKFKSKDLINSLKRVSPTTIVREGKGMNASAGRSSVYARVILHFYNSGRRTNRLEDQL